MRISSNEEIKKKIKKIIQHFENGIYDTVIGEYNITHEENISYL